MWASRTASSSASRPGRPGDASRGRYAAHDPQRVGRRRCRVRRPRAGCARWRASRGPPPRWPPAVSRRCPPSWRSPRSTASSCSGRSRIRLEGITIAPERAHRPRSGHPPDMRRASVLVPVLALLAPLLVLAGGSPAAAAGPRALPVPAGPGLRLRSRSACPTSARSRSSTSTPRPAPGTPRPCCTGRRGSRAVRSRDAPPPAASRCCSSATRRTTRTRRRCTASPWCPATCAPGRARGYPERPTRPPRSHPRAASPRG